MGAKAFRKGKAGELELMHILRDIYGYNVKRGYVAAGGTDLEGLLGIHVEVKVHKRVDIPAWITQAVLSSEKRRDGLPAVFFRQSSREHRGLPWLVVMRHQDWKNMDGEEYGSVYAKYGNQFSGGIYSAMQEAGEAACDTLFFQRSNIDLCCMYLEEWVDMYGNWKFPFTE